MFIDGTWGTFIHIGPNIMKDARMGVLNRFILTPSHHRVHHARNPLYMDTNFCNLLNIWDRLFGTLQTEEHHTPVEYGVTRKINHKNFWDVYFGEIVFLGRDIIKRLVSKINSCTCLCPRDGAIPGNIKQQR
jgi:sterol desaturase/sphingolipid hydroxylase (fatty acid hydroxylase superfamily)